jgi:hypothetical protein
MTSVNWERWVPLTGIGFVVMFIVSFFVYGESPKVNDSPAGDRQLLRRR